MTNGRIIKVT